MSRRRRSPVASLPGKQPILRLLIVAVLAIGAYLGKSQWQSNSRLPPPRPLHPTN